MDIKINPFFQRLDQGSIGEDINWKIQYIFTSQGTSSYHSFVLSKGQIYIEETQSRDDLTLLHETVISQFTHQDMVQLIQHLCEESENKTKIILMVIHS